MAIDLPFVPDDSRANLRAKAQALSSLIDQWPVAVADFVGQVGGGAPAATPWLYVSRRSRVIGARL
jgi:hypothetical protein